MSHHRLKTLNRNYFRIIDYTGAIRWLGTPYKITSVMSGSASHEQAAWFMEPVEELVRGPAINSLGCYVAFIRRKPSSLTVSWRRPTPYEQKMEPKPADR